MTESDIFVADDLLSASQAWQEVVSSMPTARQRQEIAQEACLALEAMSGFHGTRKLIVKSEAALMLRSEYVDDAPWQAIEFEKIVAKGWLGRIVYIKMAEHGDISWPLYDAQVYNTEDVEIATDDPLPPENVHRLPTDVVRKPLYLPVNLIDYALCAA